MKINVDFTESPTSFPIGFTDTTSFVVEMEEGAHLDPYEGSYDITPTTERQIIQMAHKEAIQDLIIEPIPQNYGLITWNGSYITVS